VLELKLPPLAEPATDAALLAGLMAIVPKLLTALISFALLASFWRGLHHILGQTRVLDRRLMSFVLLHLMLVCVAPFVVAVFGAHVLTLTGQVLDKADLLRLPDAARDAPLRRPPPGADRAAHGRSGAQGAADPDRIAAVLRGGVNGDRGRRHPVLRPRLRLDDGGRRLVASRGARREPAGPGLSPATAAGRGRRRRLITSNCGAAGGARRRR
jgi:hypothetical protein